MKEYAKDVLRLFPLIGTIGLFVTIAYSRTLSEALRSDNGHILGFAVSICLVPSLLGLLLARHRRWYRPKPQIAFMVPLILLGAFTVYVISNGELHGPSVAFMLFALVLLAAVPAYFVVPKVLSSSKLQLVIAVPSVLWLVTYAIAVSHITSR